MARQSLIDEYRQKARRADDRLRALESISGNENFSGVLNYSYKNAQRDIRSWGGENRFGKGGWRGLSEKELEMKISDIDKFLGSETSTKTGITHIYQERANTLNEELGLKGDDAISWQQWADFWRSDAYKNMKSYFEGSQTLVSMVAQFTRQRDEITKAIRENDFRHVNISPEIARSVAIDYLREEGLDFLDLFEE